MHRKPCKILVTPEFDRWFLGRSLKEQEQIRSRISHIEIDGYFGDHKSVSEDNTIWELRWKNGQRIYYASFGLFKRQVLLLLGGNKNGQSRDITKAKKIYTESSQICS